MLKFARKGTKMSMSDHQWEFLKDVAKLIEFAEKNGFKLTGGELYRTTPQQLMYFYGRTLKEVGGTVELVDDRRKSHTMQSNHQRRLAIDVNIFKNGKLTYEKQELQAMGDYWESLSPHNRWGGNFISFTDTPHFERNI